MFADDTTLDAFNTDPHSVENELQKSINEVSDWCSKNAMVLHPTKTKTMLLATRQKQQLRPLNLNLSLKADHIEQVHKHRHFGVIIDDEFSGQSHVTYACKTESKYLFYYLNSNTLWTLPSASYLIMLTFLLILHMPPLSGMDGVILYSKKLNSLHKRAAKLMLPDPSTTEAKIQRLGLLPLREKLMFNKAVLVFKACRNLAPQYLTSLLKKNSNSLSPRTIILPQPRIDLFKTSRFFSGESIWNSFPAQIKACSSITCFKRQLHKWFEGNM